MRIGAKRNPAQRILGRRRIRLLGIASFTCGTRIELPARTLDALFKLLQFRHNSTGQSVALAEHALGNKAKPEGHTRLTIVNRLETASGRLFQYKTSLKPEAIPIQDESKGVG